MKFTLRFKGTLKDENLCLTCSNSVVITQDNGTQRFFCHGIPGMGGNTEIKRAVVDCSSYRRAGAHASLTDMKQIAWILRTERGGSKIGFTPFKDLSKDDALKVEEEIYD